MKNVLSNGRGHSFFVIYFGFTVKNGGSSKLFFDSIVLTYTLPSFDGRHCFINLKLHIMDKAEIGMNAGKIWHLLENNAKWSYKELKSKSGLKDKELGAALGWLAREERIEPDQEGDELFVFVCVNVYIG